MRYTRAVQGQPDSAVRDGRARLDRLIGQVLAGRYEVQSVAGQEHLGRVYAAVDRKVGGPVHVKVLHASFVDNPRKFERFGREITASWLVSHPNTVEVLDWGQDGDVHFLVTEPLDGRTLEEEIEAGPLAVERVASITAQIAGAIGAAHQEGIVHRALVPRNVVLLDGARVKVRDFGMSKLEEAEDIGQTQTTLTTRIEDLSYMAPEYLNLGTFVKKSDLYSLGALTWHMLTGKAPATSGVVPHQPPSRFRPEVPAWLDELVLDLLVAEPADRPGAHRVVQRIEAGTGRRVEPPQVAAAPSSTASQTRAHPAIIALGVVAIVGLLGLGSLVILVSSVILILTLWVAS